MDAGQKRIGFAPGLDLAGRQAGKILAAGDEPSGGQGGSVLQARWLEQEFVIADDRRIARIDVEGVVAHGRHACAVGADEPVTLGLGQMRFASE